MLPFADDFHKFMRRELQKVYEGEGDLYDVFDLHSARAALQHHRQELLDECIANKRLQEKFEVCARMMRRQRSLEPEKESNDKSADVSENDDDR
jgi:hypothetical protein